MRTVDGGFVATIQKIKRAHDTAYRVLIRQANTKAITKTFDSKRLAVRFVNEIEDDRCKLISYSNNKPKTKLSVVIDMYLASVYKGTRLKDEVKKLQFWSSHLGSKQIRDIIKSDIRTTLSLLNSGLSNATINRYKASISVVFSYACREFDLPDNPVQHIRSKPENNERIRFLSDDERTRLFEACRASQWSKLYLLVLMAITTGARKGELLNLEFDDIDFDRQTAYVQTSKNGQPRVLPLTDEVITELNKFKYQEPRLIFNSELKPDRPMCFNKQWKKALTQAEITGFRYHDLRHSCASLLAQSGASLLEIAEVLGHKQIQVTKRYAHLCIDHKSKLINKVMGSL